MSVVRSVSISDEEWLYIRKEGLSPSHLLQLGIRASQEEWQRKVNKMPEIVDQLSHTTQQMHHYEMMYNQVRETLREVNKTIDKIQGDRD